MKSYRIFLTLLVMLPLAVQSAPRLESRLTPYLWFAGVEGNVSSRPGAPTVPIDISASDALEDNEASYMVLFETKYLRHGVLLDLLYTDTRSSEDLITAVGLNVKSISKNKIYSAAYLYELFQRDRAVIDVYGGVRYWKVDTELRFRGGLGILAGERIRSAESWYDPLLGIKGRSPLGGSNFYASGGLAVGGFGVSSEHFYDVSINAGYQWTQGFGTSIGYRVYDLDYEDGSFLYDVEQKGWLLGLSWAF
ncbi:hypothetical protein [Marinobacter sp. F4218]|uniref:hypothetical protein n=1 Tax=Marinobacter sp. F4218 TaxID=2862868 RepID=UPI001C631A99|nr:hypothetical protein [Marinobacter sp. F4218]MBW7469852.1 hypothetical protein [Marinobacter sp. F4218]